MNKEDLSIILVGKLKETALCQLDYYKGIAKVIISCWDDDDLSILDKYDTSGVEIVVNDSNLPSHAEFGSSYYQAVTANGALERVNTLYTIKIRLDESFGNVQPLIDLMEAFPQKIIFGSPHFSKVAEHYHAGDHYYGCRSETMKTGISILKKNLEDGFPEGCLFNNKDFKQISSSEQLVTRAMFYANGERDFSVESAREVMIRNCDVCKIKKLGSVHYTETNTLGTIYFANGTIHNEGYSPCWQESNFESIEEII